MEMLKKMIKMKLFKDILTERTKYSQGRVYLFFSIIAYYITLGILTVYGMDAGKDHETDVDLNSFEIIIESLKYAMVLFAGYVFGNKGLETIKTVTEIFQNGKKKKDDNSEPEILNG
jgi:hypothetical protein